MAQDRFDETRFDKRQYDLNKPLDLARFQRTVEQFMGLLRKNDLTCPTDQGLLDKFCTFVDDAEVWHLAQTVAPEFRLAKEDQRLDADMKHGATPLEYVLNKLTSLPPPRSDKNVLTTEQDFLSQRHKQWVEYVVTGGRGRQAATSAQQAECDERISQIEKALDVTQVQDPIQSTSESAADEGRNGQDEVDSQNVSKERNKTEAEKPIGKAPMNKAGKGRKKGKANKPVNKGPIDDHFKTVNQGV